jgi:5-hydroxyisourate hydrolase-like protein (transthyretin family)
MRIPALLAIAIVLFPLPVFAGQVRGAPQRPAGPPGTASIEGTVLRLGTSEPVAGVQVTLQPAPGTVTSPLTPVVTGKDGHFIFKTLDAGNYRLDFQSAGYVRQKYGQKLIAGSADIAAATVIPVAAGQGVKDIVMRLVPTSVLTGRVHDSSVRPLASVRVQLFRVEYDSNGEKGFQSVGSAVSDDRGEYRMAGVQPGRYFLVAGGVSGRPTNPNEIPEVTSLVFYPGVNDVGSASPIELQPGVEENGVDFTLKQQTLHRIRGRAIDVDPTVTAGRTTVLYSSASLLRGSGQSQGLFDPATGAVEIRDLAPGTYSVSVQTLFQGAARGGRFTSHVAVREITIADSDVDGIVWTTRPPEVINGKFIIEGSTPGNPPRLIVGLRPVIRGTSPTFQPPDASGAFQFQGVTPGEYRMNPAVPAPYTIKAIRYGGVDVLGKVFRFHEGETAMLEVVVAAGAAVAQISGNVTDDRGQAASPISVIMIPDERDRANLYMVARINGGPGHFTIPNVPPGNYKIFAWDAIEPYSYFDPDVMKKFEQKGKTLKIGESANETLELKVIVTEPAP